MEKNNQKNSKNIIFIICGLSILLALIFLLIFLLSVSNRQNISSKDESKIINNANQGIETYNRILKKAESEIDELSKPKQKQRISYNPDGITIDFIEEYDSSTGKIIKLVTYNDDGITIDSIHEYNPSNGCIIKLVYYNEDGKIKEIITEFEDKQDNE